MRMSARDIEVTAGGVPLLTSSTLEANEGQWISIVGPNGAGKTSLVEALAGVRRVARGTVLVDGRDVHAMSERERAATVAFVPQHPLFPAGMSVQDYVALGRHARHGLWRGPSETDHATVGLSLERVGISQLANRDVDSLSGGERQRAVIARALAQTTTFIVMDEPTNGLDVRHQVDILELVRREVVECGATVIATLHDLTLAGHFADTMVVMNEGKILTQGSAREVAASRELRDAYGIEIMVVDVAGRDVWVPGRLTTP